VVTKEGRVVEGGAEEELVELLVALAEGGLGLEQAGGGGGELVVIAQEAGEIDGGLVALVVDPDGLAVEEERGTVGGGLEGHEKLRGAGDGSYTTRLRLTYKLYQ